MTATGRDELQLNLYHKHAFVQKFYTPCRRVFLSSLYSHTADAEAPKKQGFTEKGNELREKSAWNRDQVVKARHHSPNKR